MVHPITSVKGLKSRQQQLQALGYDTVEQLIGAAQVAGPELSEYLNIPHMKLTDTMNSLVAQSDAISAADLQIITSASYPLGVTLSNIPLMTVAPPITLPQAAAKANVNMVADMPPVRDQQHRGTCVAFASLANYEHYLHTQGADQDLSEQFLYWNCKQNDGHPNDEGTWVAQAFPLLKRNGCCLEQTWAYNPNPIPGNEGEGPSPSGSQLEALTYRVLNFKQLAPTSVTDIKYELAHGRCVTFSIPVFNSWYRNVWVAKTGDIVMPVPGEIAVGGHAMCMVGYISTPKNLAIGGGRFIIRNSWGASWGISSPYGAGYGTIPFRYIQRFGSEAFAIA